MPKLKVDVGFDNAQTDSGYDRRQVYPEFMATLRVIGNIRRAR